MTSVSRVITHHHCRGRVLFSMDMIMICITAILAAIVATIEVAIELAIVVATVSSIVYSLQAIARVFTTYHSIEYINL